MDISQGTSACYTQKSVKMSEKQFLKHNSNKKILKATVTIFNLIFFFKTQTRKKALLIGVT